MQAIGMILNLYLSHLFTVDEESLILIKLKQPMTNDIWEAFLWIELKQNNSRGAQKDVFFFSKADMSLTKCLSISNVVFILFEIKTQKEEEKSRDQPAREFSEKLFKAK